MGAWGPGIFENDHALDLLGIEIDNLTQSIEAVLETEGLAFDDLEGPLIYVHLLARIGEESELGIERDVITGWRTKYLTAFDSTIEGKPDYIKKRREIIIRTFDRLLPKPAKKPAKQPVRKATPKKKRAR
jgi:hypothetical protein